MARDLAGPGELWGIGVAAAWHHREVHEWLHHDVTQQIEHVAKDVAYTQLEMISCHENSFR
jgi:hypothetical protein